MIMPIEPVPKEDSVSWLEIRYRLRRVALPQHAEPFRRPDPSEFTWDLIPATSFQAPQTHEAHLAIPGSGHNEDRAVVTVLYLSLERRTISDPRIRVVDDE